MSSNSRHVGGKLDAYRKKRDAGRTPEPFGSSSRERAHQFVVQKHDATRLHYDFRLEWGGVLLSWAVPRGPSLDPKDKRLAVHVEDHPVEYADFEGVIPKDNYGAGPVIVWDRGRFTPLEDFDEGMKKGKLLFELNGYKLRGEFTLVRTKTKGGGVSKEWLLIKHQDEWARAGHVLGEESVLSGLTVEEIGRAGERARALDAEVAKLGVKRAELSLADAEPMLAEVRDEPFSRAGWLFELKYDGFRMLAGRSGARAELKYRRGLDSTASYPEIARAIAALPGTSFILDGEVVVHDEASRPSFERLSARAQLQRTADIERASVERPAVLYVFDLLAWGGYDLRPLPLRERKRLLERLLPRAGALRYADHIEERGVEMFAEVKKLGLEGLVGKRGDSPYQSGRSADWLKVRIEQTGDFVIVGYVPPKRGRVGIGSVHVAARDPRGGLRYVAAVGSGLSDEQLRETREFLDAHRVKEPPFTGRPETSGPHVWSAPRRVCEVRFKAFTAGGGLRQPVFVRFRPDKTPGEIELAPSRATEAAPPPPPPPRPEPERIIHLTNLDKVFWPDEGYTKGELIAFYQKVSPWLLHHLRDRPVVLTRYPDGILGKSFFQKDAPGFAPPWLRTERMWSEQAEREIDYFVCDDVETLTFLVNLGTIPLHVWSSRVTTLERPDWCVLDLDPKGAPFPHVVEVALATRRLCDELELPSYVKTSGSTGLHVLVPLGRLCTFEQGRQVAHLLSQVVVKRLPERATLTRVIERRGGKVYLDFVQNGHGRLLAAPFCVRPVPGALVSTPLAWREVTPKLDPTRFTLKTVPKRMEKLGKDPIAAIVDEVPDLPRALERLAKLM